MKFSKEIIINVSEDKVWNILGPEFANIGTWATAVSHSVANDELPSLNNSPVGGRLCNTNIGTVSEEFTAYDADKKTFSFAGIIGSKIYSSLISTTEVTAKDENTSVVKITPHIVLKPLGLFMYPMVRKSLSRTIDGVLDDLKYFAENDTQSPRKAASMKK